ncbi:twin-arginine translocase subunit TatC [Weeksellaceae bacterium KMM 9724]|uniref:twin-arginine translocase subunit TatC n=1 Tax=Profundicola chukchiensis TaxID=2961959 RepID=UPI00243AF616|nr:twin-arginine translocase subunit TatC [Profundicola chukchiensis]MDG4951325.1 twin-arginine translocase subunit TatC [Profundicola chukchiensis]
MDLQTKEYVQNKQQNRDEMPFLDHISELRKHLIRAIIGVAVAMGLVGIFWKVIEGFIMAPLSSDFITFRYFNKMGSLIGFDDMFNKDFNITLKNLEFGGQFTAMIGVLLVSGIIVSLPYIVFELFQFLKPGLTPKEKKYSNATMLFTVMFFLLGVSFSYFMVIPLSVNFMYYFTPFNAANEWTIMTYINMFLQTTLAMGVVFLLPIIVYFLARIGLVTPEFLKTYRKHAFIVILTIASIITPADLLSMFVAAIPLLLLYELSVLIVKWVDRSNKAKEPNTSLPAKS